MLILLATTAWAGSVGFGPELVALQTSARHDIAPSAYAWVTGGDRPWSITGEARLSHRVDEQDPFRYETLHLSASAVAEVAAGTHRTSFRAGLGPAITWRRVDLDAVLVTTRLHPGLRSRVALDGPLGERVAWAWHVGLTTRSFAVDWDAGFGFGVRL